MGPFENSGLELVALPSTLASLGCRVFYGCYGLRRVAFRGESCLEAVGEWCSEGIGGLSVLAVLAGCANEKISGAAWQ